MKEKEFYNFVRIPGSGLVIFYQPDYMEGVGLNYSRDIEGLYFSILQVEDILGYKLLDGFPKMFQVPLGRF